MSSEHTPGPWRVGTYHCPACEDTVEYREDSPAGEYARCDCGVLLKIDHDADGDSEGYRDCSSWVEVDAMDAIIDLVAEVRRAEKKHNKWRNEVYEAARTGGWTQNEGGLFGWIASRGNA